MQGPVQHSINHLKGALRLFRMETGDFKWVDTSNLGVVRSFRAAALAFPFWLLPVSNKLMVSTTGYYAPAVYALLGLSYVIFWTLGPVIMWELARLFGREHFWRRNVVVVNWAEFWLIVLPLPLKMAVWNRPADDPQVASIALLVILLSLVFSGYLLAKTMDFRVPVAIALTICLFMISMAFSQVIQSLMVPFLMVG